MEDYYKDGYDTAYRPKFRNTEHEHPKTDGDRYSYQRGLEDGARRRMVANEIDLELYRGQ